MASKDRIQRIKEENRCNILSAAHQIAKEEGWTSLSMRKIADKIEYTAPIIYEYFQNKEAILFELSKKGYLMLSEKTYKARENHTDPAQQLEAMWLAYWDFAFDEPELYQLMFGVRVECCQMAEFPSCYQAPKDMIKDTIRALMEQYGIRDEELVCRKYYTFWSVIHGLISINFVRKELSDEMNREVFKDAVRGIIHSIKTNFTVES